MAGTTNGIETPLNAMNDCARHSDPSRDQNRTRPSNRTDGGERCRNHEQSAEQERPWDHFGRAKAFAHEVADQSG